MKYDANKGTANEGKASQYRGVGKVESRPKSHGSYPLFIYNLKGAGEFLSRREEKHNIPNGAFEAMQAAQGNVWPEKVASRLAGIKEIRESKLSKVCETCNQPFEFYTKSFDDDGYLNDGWRVREIICWPDDVKQCGKCEQALRVEVWRANKLEVFHRCNPAAAHYLKRRDKPPRPAQHVAVMDWKMEDGQGLFTYGSTGTGKTSTIYNLFEHIALTCGEIGKVIPAYEIAAKIQEAILEGELTGYLDEIKQWKILCFDDFDKCKFTERVQTELFGLLESRITSGKITFFTANIGVSQLQPMFHDNIGPAFIRRVKEHCLPINFDA